MKDSICQCCKGKGAYWTTLRGGSYQYVPCDFPGCHGGKVNHEENHRITSGGLCEECKLTLLTLK